ncbi:hypothetical protein PHYBOEH_007260 [Phytophthora boehmeriae]|uniref:Uncharacterized protein n=1 Tax=Phytophthora boehmeriae TaxID=109152 RepID=A0A8T1X892_9STRA|nr:hypothetical protein PHYBOEH_007260 [Phytophthora boehmeriae]
MAEADETSLQVYMEGLSRVDRVIDDSGYAFTALDVIDKGLVNLDPIQGYSHLLFVNVSKNQIVDATPLMKLQYLVTLDLSYNAMTAPIAFPQQYLQSLDMSGNQLTTLQGLESSALSILKISDNPELTSLVGLQGVPSLTTLEASRNNVEDISSLATDASPKLEILHLDENKLTTLSGLENLPALTSLSLQQNNIETLEDVQQLGQLSKLTTLDLTGNPVTQWEDFRLSMLLLVPTLTLLDEEPITDNDRLAAVELKRRREAEAEEQAEAEE